MRADRRLVVAAVVAAAGCAGLRKDAKPEPPRPSAAIERFATETEAIEPSSIAKMANLTRTMADAVDSLPDEMSAHMAAERIRDEATALESDKDTTTHARASLDAALGAVAAAAVPSKHHGSRDAAVAEARKEQARIGSAPSAATPSPALASAYRATADALLVATGGRPRITDDSLPALVARFARQEPEMATLTGARLVEELAAEIDAAGGRSPRVRAAVEKARAAALELGNERTLGYVPVLKKALGAAVEGLEAIAPAVHAPGLPALAATARKAVAAIDPDRPFALQRGPVQDAVRAIADAVLVARTAVSSARRFVAGQRLSAQ